MQNRRTSAKTLRGDQRQTIPVYDEEAPGALYAVGIFGQNGAWFYCLVEHGERLFRYWIRGHMKIEFVKRSYGWWSVTLNGKSIINIDEAVENAYPEILVLDFGGVTFMDSSGIGLVIGRCKLMKNISGKIAVINAPKYIKKVMRMAGIEKLISEENKKEGSFA